MKRYKKKDGTIVYRKGKTSFTQMKIKDVTDPVVRKKEQVKVGAIIQTQARYSEKPRMIFLVTPPHLIEPVSNMCYNVIEYIINYRKDCEIK